MVGMLGYGNLLKWEWEFYIAILTYHVDMCGKISCSEMNQVHIIHCVEMEKYDYLQYSVQCALLKH